MGMFGMMTRCPIHCVGLWQAMLFGVNAGKKPNVLMNDSRSGRRDAAYSSYPHAGSRAGHSIRTARFRYTEWLDREPDAVDGAVWTDIEGDPGETAAIMITIGDAANTIEQRLSKLLRERLLGARKQWTVR